VSEYQHKAPNNCMNIAQVTDIIVKPFFNGNILFVLTIILLAV